jgi:hypothetical protein
MSYKGLVEDKAAKVELPRTLTELIALMDTLERALRRQDRAAVKALLPDFEERRRCCHVEQTEWSRLGKSGEVGVVFANRLNQCMELSARALWLTTSVGFF